MGSIELVVTDLDGTLWHTDDHVPAPVLGAVAELERRGTPLLVATGRRLASTRGPLARHGLAPPAVVLNGALGVDLVDGARWHRAAFEPTEANAVAAAFASVDVAPVAYVDHVDHDTVVSESPDTHPDHAAALAARSRVVRRDELATAIAGEVVLGFGMIGAAAAVAEAARGAVAALAEVHLDRSMDHPGSMTLTVAPRGQSKWNGVLAFCDRRGLDSTRVLALADGANDLELLERAAVGLVPSVAHPEALSRATTVIGPAAEGGWAAVLDHL
ncbi:MAG: HAD family hydrolase [Desertimonas sp.]